MILAVDIGGTKVSVALFDCRPDSSLVMLDQKSYRSSAYFSVNEVLANFLLRSTPPLKAISIGIAGPICDGLAEPTNLSWRVDSAQIKNEFGAEHIFLLNDLEAHAYGVCGESVDVKTLHAGALTPGNKALIAAGTGLGECLLIWDKRSRSYLPSASEGGHASFSPVDEEQVRLLRHTWKKYPHVSCERLISGSFGFALIYDFLKSEKNILLDEELDEALKHATEAGPLLQAAAEGGSAIALKTLEIFTHLLASEAGNLALKAMSSAGVYLGGGVAMKMWPWFERFHFHEVFARKGRFQNYLQKVPIYVIQDEFNALKGAASYAAKEIYT